MWEAASPQLQNKKKPDTSKPRWVIAAADSRERDRGMHTETEEESGSESDLTLHSFPSWDVSHA